MKITDHRGCLELQRLPGAGFPYLRLAARIQAGSGVFTGENKGVMYCGGAYGKELLQSFKAFTIKDVRVELTEGCHLELHRHPRGDVEVRFVISVFRSGSETSMQGLVTVDGEYSSKFMEELWKEIAD